MIKDFNEKVAVITGGASGIGLGLAKAFTKSGMKLVLADINKEALDTVSKEFSDNNVEAMTVITDVSDPKQVAHLADASFEYKVAGVLKTKSMHLSVIKDEKWIWVSISPAANNFDEKLKEIIYSLEFH